MSSNADDETASKLKALFMQLDSSRDGLLSFNELSSFLMKLNPDNSRREIYQLYQSIDQNHDGRIDVGEFIDYMFQAKPGNTKTDASESQDKTQEKRQETKKAALKMQAPADAFYEDLKTGDGCKIDAAERRGITVPQLTALLKHVNRRCNNEKWADICTNSPTYGEALTFANINQHHIIAWVVKPCTGPSSTSFVEFIASKEQPPDWFVSHAWSEPHNVFVKCIHQQKKDRALAEHTSYWVCAYATNHWALEEDVVCDPFSSSFRKAIDLADGTLSVLGEDDSYYTRIWCCYEVYVTLVMAQDHKDQSARKLYDVYTSLCLDSHRKVVGMTDGVVAVDLVDGEESSATRKCKRESAFPASFVKAALRLQFESCKAFLDSDRNYILNTLAGSEDPGSEPPEKHDGYTKANSLLRGHTALAAWRWAIVTGEDLSELTNPLVRSNLERLSMSFRGCEQNSNGACFEAIGSSIPFTIKDLHLDFSDCEAFDDDAMTCLVTGLRVAENCGLSRLHLAGLRQSESVGPSRLHLHFANCSKLTNSVCIELASALSVEYMSKLEDVCLDFTGVTQLGESAVDALAVALQSIHCLKRLCLSFQGCEKITPSSVANLISSINCKEVQVLNLSFANCSRLTNQVLTAMAGAIKTDVYLPAFIDDKRVISQDSDGFKLELRGLTEGSKPLDSELNSDVVVYRNSTKIDDFYTGGNYDKAIPWNTQLEGTMEDGWLHIVLRPSCLQHVCLNFQSCRFLHLHGAKQVLSSLSCLESLLQVELNFESCPNIPASHVQSFAEQTLDAKITTRVSV
eukprot:TRINITY_DN24005_c0_g1_i1.p1 TRINITY_DN24005_c0_g1~~TRINITY_DN24005_c0_g1_i1.p1  ORF type:complete len:812 (-),score=138.02 TRINITY_DN24005_c0_g1_i1:158-2557(-)